MSSTSGHSTSTSLYNPKGLLDLPRRIASPPKPDVPRVGRVRTFSLTPAYDVKLEDVLAGKHLPPLGLPEFEAYLMYTERSPENLYFLLWFKDYEKQYQAWSRSPTHPRQSPTLAYSYTRAKQTFLDRGSAPLELNLPAAAVNSFFTNNRSLHPAPAAFADIRYHVESMLKESLHNFVRSSCTNAGRNRGFFAIFVGIVSMCIGLAPILVSALDGKSRWLRFAALPCFWFGATTLICGLHGVCIVIFLFGDARQLAAYELAGPEIPVDMLYGTKSAKARKKPNVAPQHDASLDVIEISLATATNPSDSSHSLPHRNASEVQVPPGIDVSPPYTASEKYNTHTRKDFKSTPTASRASSIFDFDYLPAPLSSETKLPSGPPMFAPLTKVLDSITIRACWDTVMRSAILALMVALILVAIAIAIE